jgi:mono/diheme cytochrome c family protein
MTVFALRMGTFGLLGVVFLAFRLGASGPALAIEPTGVRAAKDAMPQEVFRHRCVECHDVDGRGESMRAEFPRIPDFTDRGWQASRSDAELGHSILEGRAKAMPRMKNKLGSVDVGRMVAFVRAFAGGKQVVRDESEPEPEGRVTAAAPRPLSPWERVPEGRVRAGAPPNAVASLRERVPEGRVRAGAPPNASASDRVPEGMRLFQRLCIRCHGPDGRGSEMRESLPSLPDFTRPAWQEGRSDPQILASVLGGKGTGMPSFGNRLGPEQARHLAAYIRALAPVPVRTDQAATATDDFEARFAQLKHEIEELGRQFHALSEAPRSP